VKQRIARVQRLIELRERQLTEAVGFLTRAQVSEHAALTKEQECRAKVTSADAERRALATKEASAASYVEHENWLETVVIQHGRAFGEYRRAKAETLRCRQGVQHARVSMKQVQLLLERLEQRQAEVARRVERRNEDELAQALSARKAARVAAYTKKEY
jgi:hypothetical protein